MFLRSLISAVCMLVIISSLAILLAFSYRSTQKNIEKTAQYIEKANERSRNGIK